MERAAILIGVSRTGQLPELQATSEGVRKMAAWARSQGITRLREITDENGGSVTLDGIKRAVREVTDPGNVDQLIVYFAGHGMYNLGTEYWLLSDAPEDSNAAVSVALSQDRARIGSCQHVIFISDACRTTVAGQQFASIMGGNIFPSPSQPARPEQSVDLFFACGFDSTSIEVKTADGSVGYRSIYTDILHDALSGLYRGILDPDPTTAPTSALVKTQTLKPFLTKTVPNVILQQGFPASAVQTPDARICSPASAWISRITPIPSVEITSIDVVRPGRSRTAGLGSSEATDTKQVQIALSDALENPSIDPFDSLRPAMISMTDSLGDAAFVTRATTQSVARRIRRTDELAPDHFETGCGFFFGGAEAGIARVLGGEGLIEEQTGDAVKIRTQFPVDVLLTTTGGRGTVLPAIPGYIASLSFHDDLLMSVSWQQIGPPIDPQIVGLRSLIASLSQRGALHLDTVRAAGIDAPRLARRIRDAKTADPSMALYAGYAFYDLQMIDHITSMASYLFTYTNVEFFDLSLLSRSLPKNPRHSALRPFFPLLSRGWSMLEVDELPPLYLELYPHLTASHWTLFEALGVDLLQNIV